MPLSHGKSKKAFEGNLKAELNAGKPKDQALAIAYSVQRKAQHKAKGGEVKVKRIDNPSLVQSKLKIKEGHSLDKRFEHEDGEPHQEKSAYAEGGVISAKSEKRPSTQEVDNALKTIQRLAEGGGVLSAASEKRPNIDTNERAYDPEEIEMLHENEDEPIPVDEYIATHEGPMDDQESDRLDRIMRKRAMAHGGMYAKGGEVENGQVDLDDNAIEHSNHEDDLSHDLTDEEAYSLSDALDSIGTPKDSDEHGDEEEKESEDRADRIMLKRAKRK